MKISRRSSGFALAVTLVLMALIVIVIVAYLANTRTDRSTSSIYANQLKARMVAESGLAAATTLLSNNTRYGNYITAMPAPSPSPAKLYTEVYRPTDPADTTVAKANDYLQFTNAAGEILASRAPAIPSGTPQIEPRPTPVMIPPAGPFSIADPGFTNSNSYDFNQIVRLGTNANGRLVQSSPTPVYGQWVRLRNGNNELIGRYAFFIEDESMKTNVNVTGNNTAGSNARINDLIVPEPPGPPTQLEEVDPAAVLPVPPASDRVAADVVLTGLGNAGSRLPSRSTLALLNQWNATFSDYAHLITATSLDDDTTAKGWQRMDINALVSSTSDNASKIAAAWRIANWIRDAWTGATITNLQDYQMFNDPRLRLQMAANIIDYIDVDSIPTDLGNYPSIGVFPVNSTEYPVIGIEKIPYLSAIEIIYQASNSNGTSSATLKMKIQFRFMNLYETDLDLANSVGRIEIKGVPIVSRNGSTVFDVSTTNYVIPFASLTTVTSGNGTLVLKGVDGIGDSGARTFQTGWLESRSVTFNGAGSVKPVFLAGAITAKVYGAGSERLDDTAVATNIISTGYNWNGSTSTGDFLKDALGTTVCQAASISLIYQVPAGITTPLVTGDPRVRGPILNGRWYNITRSDASTPAGTNRIDAFIDKAEIGIRAYAFDWYDSIQVRPLAFLRNGPMRSIGELGNIAAAEYPWRTFYLQYPERPVNTVQIGPVTEVPLRRSSAVDYFLADLFRTHAIQPRVGALNLNTQKRFGTQQHALNPLWLGLPAGAQILSQSPTFDPIDKIIFDPNAAPAPAPAAPPPIYSISQRRAVPSPPTDNTPVRPFFQIGELASPVSRLVNSSIRVAGESRSTVTYSILRANPTLVSDIIPDYRSDMLAEQEFREVSNSITTRGNVFRVLYVGQAIKDMNNDGIFDPSDLQAEYLGEAFVERQSVFQPEGSNPDAVKTANSTYKIIANRVVTQ